MVVRRFTAAGVILLLCVVLLAVAAPPKSRVGSSRIIDAEPQIRCLIFQPMVGRLHSSILCAVAAGDGEEFLSLIRQGGLATTMGLRASARGREVRVVCLEAAVPSRKEVHLTAYEEDTQEWTLAGSFRANLSPIKLPSSASSASFSARDFSARLILGEGL